MGRRVIDGDGGGRSERIFKEGSIEEADVDREGGVIGMDGGRVACV